MKPGEPSRPHIAALDGLRGIAIAAVMTFHLYAAPGWGPRVTAFGALGVNLFFALSGFLITGILLDAKSRPFYFRNFYARRALRIWPLYYATLALLLVVIPALHSVNDAKFQYAVAHQFWLWIYANNFYEAATRQPIPLFGHFWSLAVEEQFYFVWPVLVFVLSARRLLMICAIAVVIAIVSRFALIASGLPLELAVRITFCQVDSLAVGAAIAILGRQLPSLSALRSASLISIALALAAMILIGLWPNLQHTPLGYAVSGAVFAAGFGGLVVGGLGALGSGFQSFLEGRTLRWLGKYSYALYVFHWPIGRVMLARFSWMHATTASYAVVTALVPAAVSCVAAFASWHLFEKHFLRLKRFFEPGVRLPKAIDVVEERGAG